MKTSFFAVVFSLYQTPTLADISVIHAGSALVGNNLLPQSNISIFISKNTIIALKAGHHKTYDNQVVKVIDFSNAYVLPGLIDSHVHVTQSPAAFSKDRIAAEVTLSEADRALMGARQAHITLKAGFTTIRNVGGFRGGDGEAIFALRDAINRGDLVGPRILAAGQAISVIGGHADTHGFKSDISKALISPGICTGADQCAAAARTLIKRGADLIKVTVTGGVTDIADSGLGQHFSDQELNAIVQASHLLGRKVAAHAHSAQGINAALRAGVDSIEHGTFADKKTIKLFKKKDAYFVTTLTAPTYLSEQAEKINSTMPPIIKQKLRTAMKSLEYSTMLAYQNGVPIAIGTDSGVSPHGENAREFELLAKAGMDNRDIIKAATVNGARLLSLQEKIGSIEVGKFADFVVTCKNPIDDIKALQSISAVVKDGVIIKNNACE